MKRLLLLLLALAISMGMVSRGAAQAPAAKPVAVLSIASVDRLLADAAMLGNLAGNPDLDKNVEEMLKLFTQGQGLAGLDRKKPLGVTLITDGMNFQPLIFLPVSDYKQLTGALAPLIGEPLNVGRGAQELTILGQKIYLKNQNNWVYIGQSPDDVVAAPADPMALLGGMEKTYDVALRLLIQNIPEAYRALAIDQMKIGVESGLERAPGETDAEYAEKKKAIQEGLESTVRTLTETDQLTLGIGFDTAAKSALIDITASAVAGSKTAQGFAQMQAMPSDFAGFLAPGAAASFNTTSKIQPQDAEQTMLALQTAKREALKGLAQNAKADDPGNKLAQELATAAFEVLEKTIAAGRLDAGGTLNLSDKGMTLVLGAAVADASALEGALKKYAAFAATKPDYPTIKFDAEKHQDIRFHTASVPVPKEEAVSKIIGEKLDLAVGIGPKSAYLAIGTDCLNTAKGLIDKSKGDTSKSMPPTQLNVAMAPLFKFAAAMNPGEMQVAMMAAELAKANGKDKLTLLTVPQPPNAVTVRLEFQEAVLRLLANAGKMAAGVGGPPPGIPVR